MSPLDLASLVLSLVPIGLQTAILFVMLRRGLGKVFPVFLFYNVVVVARDLVLLVLPYGGNLYSAVFWGGEAVTILLSLVVILEVLWHLFRPYQFLRFVFKLVAVTAVVATAFAFVVLRAGPQGADRLLELILLMERSARVLQAGLLIVLISIMSRLGFTWHDYALGIAAGFGVFAALDLVLLEFRAHLHLITDTVFELWKPAAYNLGVLIWAYYFLWPRTMDALDRLPETDLATWHDTLSEYLKQWYRR
jgi:hypothetical protein